ncbi:MAG: hypothetical protein WD671_11850 [Parvibaculum sp.]
MPLSRRAPFGPFALPVATPPDLKATPEPANRMQIDRQYDDTKRQHPESKEREETENTENHQEEADHNSDGRRPRNIDFTLAQTHSGHDRLLSPRGS